MEDEALLDSIGRIPLSYNAKSENTALRKSRPAGLRDVSSAVVSSVT